MMTARLVIWFKILISLSNFDRWYPKEKYEDIEMESLNSYLAFAGMNAFEVLPRQADMKACLNS